MSPEKKLVRTFCSRMGDGGCGLIFTVEGNKAVKVEGDADCPTSQGFICHRARALLELLYHPDRLTYPRIRKGERGSGNWRRVSWDEALDYVAEKIMAVKDKYGAKAILFGLGGPKGLEIFLANRLASLIGTPNVASAGNICHLPRELGYSFTYGAPTGPDLDAIPKCLVLWGINPWVTNTGGLGTRAWTRRVLDAGAKVIVIDPRKTEIASKAHRWFRIRPGSDAALALGVLKIVVEEQLYDADFTSKWTVGLEELREHLKEMDLDSIGKITEITLEKIKEIAHTYACNRPSVILLGNALDHNSNSFQASRAVAIIKAITGNIDVEGGEVIHTVPNLKRPAEFMLAALRREIQREMLGAEFKIAQRSFFVPRQLIPGAILEQTPYPLKCVLLFGTNPLVSYADSQEIYEALRNIEFLSVSDLFMTPTAELADLVLPAATFLEYDEIGYYGLRSDTVVARPQVVEPIGECWSDIKIINELGKRLGFSEYFWEEVEQSLDEILSPSGITFEQFKERGILESEKRYRKYENAGFRTPSGKVELYSQRLKDMGYPPLPTYIEPPATSSDYPFVLTSAKSPYFYHSSYRHLESLRKRSPEPIVKVNPETAARLGLSEGDFVWIETHKGRIKQRIKFDRDLDPSVVFADFGWWYPEKGKESLYGWREGNLNVLSDYHSPAEPAVGSTYLRGFPCRLSKI
jgi:anaerobic selenocysteine-containing dehydrogenase